MKNETVKRVGRVLVVAGLAAMVPVQAVAQNLVVNASFEHDISGWQLQPDDTTLEMVHRADIGSTLANGSGPGALEVRLSFWNGSAGGPFQEVPVTPGVEYLVESSVMLPSGTNDSNGARLIVSWLNDLGFVISSDWLSTWGLGYDSWLRQSDSFVAPAGAVTAQLMAAVSTPVVENGTIPGIGYFDDIVFQEAGATVARQVLFVPGSASANGQNGTVWTTTGWLVNLVDFPVEIAGAFLRQGQDNSSAVAQLTPLVTVPGGGYVEIADMVAKLGGAGASGGIFLEATAQAGGLPATLVRATTYTSTPDPGSQGAFGQGLPAVGAGALNHVVIPGVYQNTDHRTNLGVLNTSDSTVSVDIRVMGSNGEMLGSASWTLRPFEQRQVSVTNLGVEAADGGFATITRTSEQGSFRAYLSVVDQATGDAVYTPGM